MTRPKLSVQKRTVTGKKIKKLRKSGLLPANIYGKDIKSISVQVPYKDFESLYKIAGETGLIDVEIDGQLKPILIKNVQKEPISKQVLHADFYQVNLKEKITAMIPVVTIGEAKAVTEKVGLLLTPISEIEVEALPEDLPEKIEVNVENLAAVDEQITVADLKIPKGVEVKTDPSQVVVKVAELVSEEAKEVAAEMAAEQAAAAEAVPAEEGAEKPAEGEVVAPAEGEAKPEAETKSAEEPKKEEAK